MVPIIAEELEMRVEVATSYRDIDTSVFLIFDTQQRCEGRHHRFELWPIQILQSRIQAANRIRRASGREHLHLNSDWSVLERTATVDLSTGDWRHYCFYMRRVPILAVVVDR
jgi:hypothetical protein